MADESDVGNAIVALLVAACYPTGTGNPSAFGFAVKIARGWPVPAELDAALDIGKLLITVFSQNGTEQNRSRFSLDWYTLTPPVKTLGATIAANQVTITGTPSSPQNFMIAVGDFLATQKVAIYPVQPGDTLTQIAAGLASLLTAAGVASTSVGAVVTLPATTAGLITAKPGGYGTIVRELKRQERVFMISLWCNSPAQRDQVSGPIDVAMARPENLLFADGSTGRLRYERTHIVDEKQTRQIFRRDLIYCVEYATLETQAASEILAVQTAVTPH